MSESSPLNRTPLHASHLEAGARMVDFGGWHMPIHYGSQLEEHHSVRRHAGLFDVSHMTVVDLRGPGTLSYLRHLLANDIDRVTATVGKALYSCMLNEQGGVIDDLIAYYQGPEQARLVVNASTREKDLAWLEAQRGDFELALNERADLAMIAIQGPKAREIAHGQLSATLAEAASALKRFQSCVEGEWMVARTGYTGEDGYEVILPGSEAPALWKALIGDGAAPCGLGARDTLRLEAGMNLYGNDMDESISPLEANLAWTVAFEPAGRDFVGRAALVAQRDAGVAQKLVGLVLEGRGVLRSHQRLFSEGEAVGEITSGGFSPTLQGSIAFARVPSGMGERCEVEIRDRLHPARVVSMPFVRNGKVQV